MNEVTPSLPCSSRCALYVSGFVSRALAQPRWQRDGFTPSIISSLLSNALQATPKRRRRHFARAPPRWLLRRVSCPFSPSLPLLTPLPGVFRLVFSFVASPPPPIMGWHLPGPHADMGCVSRMHGVQCRPSLGCWLLSYLLSLCLAAALLVGVGPSAISWAPTRVRALRRHPRRRSLWASPRESRSMWWLMAVAKYAPQKQGPCPSLLGRGRPKGRRARAEYEQGMVMFVSRR